MAKSTAARKTLVQVHPASTSRIERASIELTGIAIPPDQKAAVQEDILKRIASAIERYGVRPIIAALEDHKKELSDRLLAMVRREGEVEIEKGVEKVRYETDLHKFQIIKGKNVYIGEKELRLTMTACSIPVKTQEKVLSCKSVTEYEYVGVYPKKQEDGIPGSGK